MTNQNRKIFNAALFIVNALEELREYIEGNNITNQEESDIILSMIEGLKNMGNALCNLSETKMQLEDNNSSCDDCNGNNVCNVNSNKKNDNTFGTLNNDTKITEEVMNYVKEIKEEIRKNKEKNE